MEEDPADSVADVAVDPVEEELADTEEDHRTHGPIKDGEDHSRAEELEADGVEPRSREAGVDRLSRADGEPRSSRNRADGDSSRREESEEDRAEEHHNKADGEHHKEEDNKEADGDNKPLDREDGEGDISPYPP